MTAEKPHSQAPNEPSDEAAQTPKKPLTRLDWRGRLKDPLAWLWVVVAVLVVGNLGLLVSSSADSQHAENLSQQLDEETDQFDRLSFWQQLWAGEEDPLPLRVSDFDGLPIDPETEERMISVMIDNFSLARPQHSGVRSASIVYEALAEGGITRLMLMFPYQELDRVGPVRSARDYFVDFAEEYGGLYLHAGGSPAALDQLWASASVFSIEEDDRLEGNTYSFRDEDFDAPHNLFFDLLLTKEWAEDAKYTLTEVESEWCFGEEVGSQKSEAGSQESEVGGQKSEVGSQESEVGSQKSEVGSQKSEAGSQESEVGSQPLERETVELIKLDFSNDVTSSYYVQFEYDEAQEAYRRYYGSGSRTPHIDSNDSLQVAPKNLIVQVAPTYLIDGDEKERLSMLNTGSGDAVIYSKGKRMVAEWSKEGPGSMTHFTDLAGNPMCLEPGQTWISVVDTLELVEEE